MRHTAAGRYQEKVEPVTEVRREHERAPVGRPGGMTLDAVPRPGRPSGRGLHPLAIPRDDVNAIEDRERQLVAGGRPGGIARGGDGNRGGLRSNRGHRLRSAPRTNARRHAGDEDAGEPEREGSHGTHGGQRSACTASTMCRAEMPNLSRSSSGFPLRGMSRTARRCTRAPSLATADSTASPIPPAG